MEKEIFLTKRDKKFFKNKLKNVQRPNWTINNFRDKKKFWLDKNENCDELLHKETKKIFDQIKVDSIFSYPNLSKLYKKLPGTLFQLIFKYLIIYIKRLKKFESEK